MRINIFSKIVLLVLLLLVPIAALYAYSNFVSRSVMKDKIQDSESNRLLFFLNQIDTRVEQIASNAFVLSRDSALADFVNIDLYGTSYDGVVVKNNVLNKLATQAASVDWINRLTVYAPQSRQELSVSGPGVYSERYLRDTVSRDWQYRADKAGVKSFALFTVIPVTAFEAPEKARLIVESRFSNESLVDMLDKYKTSGQSDPFLYHPAYTRIANRSANLFVMDSIEARLRQTDAEQTAFQMDIDGRSYLVVKMKSAALGWYAVDYLPLHEIMAPIRRSNVLFYSSIALLLALSVAVSFLLYRNVQAPIKVLMRYLQKLSEGNFAARIAHKPRNEFGYFFEKFNGMADQIQQLIETVYLEQIQSKEAQFKLLQAQVNPHFLYNCLSFIKNMAVIGDERAVIDMSVRLGEYFRYVTRLENQLVPIGEEIELIDRYLGIMRMRMKRIHYRIDVPEAMLALDIPRLLLQPLVENAVVHGLEPKHGEGWIAIRGEMTDATYRLVVADDGVGVTEEKLAELRGHLQLPLQEGIGFGVWNVHQRVMYQFGREAGLELVRSEEGGLTAAIYWPRTTNGKRGGGERHAPGINDRR
ncbi:MAG: sensor histidine kinase [Paenibacillaceae bacterium]|nr:sensor histidine kinase [Paenibacillaceae bacterium]